MVCTKHSSIWLMLKCDKLKSSPASNLAPQMLHQVPLATSLRMFQDINSDSSKFRCYTDNQAILINSLLVSSLLGRPPSKTCDMQRVRTNSHTSSISKSTRASQLRHRPNSASIRLRIQTLAATTATHSKRAHSPAHPTPSTPTPTSAKSQAAHQKACMSL